MMCFYIERFVDVLVDLCDRGFVQLFMLFVYCIVFQFDVNRGGGYIFIKKNGFYNMLFFLDEEFSLKIQKKKLKFKYFEFFK